MIDLQKLILNGVQFGHQTWRWSPRMHRYIWGKKNGVHLIDVSKTAAQLEKATQFIEEVVASGRQVLWVGTKKAAQNIVNETADRLKCPRATHRWVGGTLTNYPQVKKSVTKLLHFEDIVEKADKALYTKKELGSYQKVVARLQKTVGGVRHLSWPVGALIVIDAKKEATAIKEANVMGVPVVALVDTNSDPSGVAIVIPGNDDVARAINVIVDELAGAVERGLEKAHERKAAEPAEAHDGQDQSAADHVLGQTEEEEEEERTSRRTPRTRRPERAGGEGLVVPDQKAAGQRFGGRPRQSWQRSDGQPLEGQTPEGGRTGGAPRSEGQRPYGPRSDRPYTPRSDRPYTPRTEGQEGSRPEGQRPYGPRSDRPYTPRPYGPRSDRPYTPRAEGQEGSRPEGQRPYGPRSDRPYTPRTEGQDGSRPEGQRPYGPRSDRPYSPRPNGQRPYGPRSDRPYTPRTEGQDGSRPEGQRSYGPRSDRPYSQRPHGQRPYEQRQNEHKTEQKSNEPAESSQGENKDSGSSSQS